MIETSWFRMSRYLEDVCYDAHGQSLGPTWKTQLFLLSEICTVILWQDCGKDNLREVLLGLLIRANKTRIILT